jgi:hypothetical protein
MSGLTVALSGSRDWQDAAAARAAVSCLPVGTRLLVGDNPSGLDAIVRSWKGEMIRMESRWEILEFTADWDRYGLKAGPIRNRQMLEYRPAFVLAFHRSLQGGSKGTRDMVAQARERDIPVILFERELSPG